MDSIFTALIPTEDVGKPRGGSAGVVRDRRVVGDDRLLGVEGMSGAAGIVVGTIVFGMVLDDEGQRVDRIRTAPLVERSAIQILYMSHMRNTRVRVITIK